MYDQIEESSFDSFDPDNFDVELANSYDPDYATGKGAPVRRVAPARKMQINITIQNGGAEALTVELFSAFDSFLNRRKAELVKGGYTMVPLNSLEGRTKADLTGTVGVNQDGVLEIRGGAGDTTAKIMCNEYPYASLVEYTKRKGFKVSRLRYTVSTDLQIDNNITHFRKTIGGGVRENTISPRAYFKPNQYQGKTIDIDQPFDIDGDSGLLIPLNAGETVRLSLFISL